jgi:predicted RNA polymerase sigma factor
MLRSHDPSPVVRLNRAVAVAHVLPVEVALSEVDALAGELRGYSYLHAVRAHLLRQLGRDAEAVAADSTARTLTQNPAELALLAERIAAGSGESSSDE